MQNVQVTDTTVTGSIETDREALLMTSIPYDPGWSVTLNGEKAEITAVDGALVAVRLPEAGNYELEFSYTPPGLNAGILLSIAGLVLTGAFIWFCDFRKKKS